MKRREAREKAVQALFQITVGQADVNEALEHVTSGSTVPPFLRELVVKTIEHMDAIDDMIKDNLINWQFNRIGNIDKTILRLSITELKFFEDVPTKVTINEAVELAKKYGEDDSAKFINGILAKVAE